MDTNARLNLAALLTALILFGVAALFNFGGVLPNAPTPGWLTNTPSRTKLATFSPTAFPQLSETLLWTENATKTETVVETAIPTVTFTSSTPATSTPTATETPTASSTHTPKPQPTPTPSLSSTETPEHPTPTPESLDLRACLLTSGALCLLPHNLTLDTTLIISGTGITLRCLDGATITTSASNLGRALTINNAISVLVQDCSFKREKNFALSAIGDVILIANSEDITLDHVTACCSTDEILDVQNSTDVDVLYSMIVYPQHCSTHRSGTCHGYNMLATNSEVLCDHCLFASGQARLPYCQKAICTVVNSIWYNINGQGLSAVDASVITFQGNIFLSGPNTQPEFYGIVSPNHEDYVEHPRICENGNRLFGEVVYRVRRPSDRAFYVECLVVPLPAESEYWVRLWEIGAPSALTEWVRESVKNKTGMIVHAPIG